MPKRDERYPRTYKEQRLLEAQAKKNRDKEINDGHKTIPICGYSYTTRANRNGAVTPTATVCMRNAGAMTDHYGRGYCDYHEVDATVRADRGGKQMQAARQHAYQQAKFFGDPINTDPYTAILDEINRTAGIIAWLDDRMAKDREALIKAGTSPDDVDHQVLQQFNAKAGFLPSVWIQLYKEERAHLITVCTAAIKAGIAERKVRIAEEQGRLIATMMLAFIHDPDLGLTPQQLFMAPELVRKHLLALPNANNNTDSIDPRKVLEVEGIEL